MFRGQNWGSYFISNSSSLRVVLCTGSQACWSSKHRQIYHFAFIMINQLKILNSYRIMPFGRSNFGKIKCIALASEGWDHASTCRLLFPFWHVCDEINIAFQYMGKIIYIHWYLYLWWSIWSFYLWSSLGKHFRSLEFFILHHLGLPLLSFRIRITGI